MSNDDRLWQELQGIKRILTLRYSEEIESYINSVITTPNRKIMWISIDGAKDVAEIAKEADVSEQAVRDFLKVIVAANLAEWKPRGIPRRLIEHTPARWLVEKSKE